MRPLSRRELLATCASTVLLTDRAAADDGTGGLWLRRAAAALRDELQVPAVWLAGSVLGEFSTAVAGVRKHGDSTPAALGDKLMIASISKPFTGSWIGWMVQQGKVSYQARLLEHVPELREDCRPEHQAITLAQLLTHTAGVKRDVYPKLDFSRSEVLPAFRLAIAKELVSSPGPNPAGQALYSNAGLTTAALLVERAASVNYNLAAPEFFRDRLGLSTWGMGSPNPSADLSAPWHHRIVSPGQVEALASRSDHPSLAAYPSGGVHCTISDLARFGQLTLEQMQGRSAVLRAATLREMLAARPDSTTTLGAWGRSMVRESEVFGHSGGLSGLGSYLEIIPDLQLVYAYVVTTGWAANPPDVGGRARTLVRDELRRLRMRRMPPPACELALTGVATVDAERRQEVRPSFRDDKIRINVRFAIQGSRTGDLQVRVSLGREKRENNFYRGLTAGNHLLYFDFEVPKTAVTPLEISLDALGTSGNRTPAAARFRSELRLA